MLAKYTTKLPLSTYIQLLSFADHNLRWVEIPILALHYASTGHLCKVHLNLVYLYFVQSWKTITGSYDALRIAVYAAHFVRVLIEYVAPALTFIYEYRWRLYIFCNNCEIQWAAAHHEKPIAKCNKATNASFSMNAGRIPNIQLWNV